MRRLEAVINVCLIVASIAFCAAIVQDRWLPGPSTKLVASASTNRSLKGSRLQLNGVNWNRKNKTIVLALSTTCRFCQESVSFYKQLSASDAVKSGRVAIVTVFSQQQEEADAFLKSNGIYADVVLSAPPQAVGALATPTLLLVDGKGEVEREWVGQLSESQQRDFLLQLDKAG